MALVAVAAIIAALVVLFAVTEILAAVLPILVIITLVPPEQRPALAELIAAADSSRKLRLWTALRVAVVARRLNRPTQSASSSALHPQPVPNGPTV